MGARCYGAVVAQNDDEQRQSAESRPAEPPEPSAREPAAPPEPEPTILERLRASPITFAITAINIAVFVVAEYWGGGTEHEGTLLRFGALEPIHIWAGEYWRIVTPMFLHIGLVHIAVNTYMSIGWSTSLERVLGKGRFLFLYLASGIAGSFFSVISSLVISPHISAGASGALFGVVGATLALRRRMLPDWKTFVADRGTRSILFQFVILTLVGVYAHFDNSAHLGGLLAGFAIIAILTARRGPRAAGKSRTPLWMALAVVYAVLFAFTTRPWWTPSGELAVWANTLAADHLDGKLAPAASAHRPTPSDIASGTRIATKACDRGIAMSCAVLANYLFRTADPANTAKAEALEKRACEIDPPLCEQRH